MNCMVSIREPESLGEAQSPMKGTFDCFPWSARLGVAKLDILDRAHAVSGLVGKQIQDNTSQAS